MSPNFWGCRCCGGPTNITLRMLDSSGNELWTWGEHGLANSGVYYRNDGFCISSDGYVGHVGGRYDPYSIGVIDPNGATVWQSINDVVASFGGTITGLSFPAFDPYLNLYAVLQSTLVSYDITGSKRWQKTLPNPNSGTDGVRCNGGAVYVQCFSGAKRIIAAYDYDGNLTGQKDYYSTAGMFGAGSPTFNVNSDGHAMMMNQFPEEIDIIDETCTTVSSVPFTMNASVEAGGPAYDGVKWPVYDMAEISSGDLVAVGTRYYSFTNGAAVAYNLTNDEAIFQPVAAWNTTANSYIYPANSSIDGYGSIYCVVNRLIGGERNATVVNKHSESGDVLFAVHETGDVQVTSIPGRLLLGSSTPRPKNGWSITTP